MKNIYYISDVWKMKNGGESVWGDHVLASMEDFRIFEEVEIPDESDVEKLEL